eukprot:9840062-Alexandrium_andersonii.AAC.1
MSDWRVEPTSSCAWSCPLRRLRHLPIMLLSSNPVAHTRLQDSSTVPRAALVTAPAWEHVRDR